MSFLSPCSIVTGLFYPSCLLHDSYNEFDVVKTIFLVRRHIDVQFVLGELYQYTVIITIFYGIQLVGFTLTFYRWRPFVQKVKDFGLSRCQLVL